MTSRRFRPARFLRTAALAAALGAALAGAAPALAQDPASLSGILTMEGRGTVSVAPDMAVITASVVSTGKNAAGALSENSIAVARVIEAIKAQGIAAKDIRTRGFGIYPRYDHSKATEGQPEIQGYEIRNGVEVNVRDLAKLGDLLTLVVDSGANAVDGIRFEVSDPGEKLDEARQGAVADARHKAGVFAAAAGVELGGIVSIAESGVDMPRPVMMRAEAMMAKSGPVPVEAGEETIAATVTIRWSLK
ncbi:SIMPL domain-containing protein [Roseibium sp. AS2]|uniref:SIMPL domain-containing protein n=1 Tax=Roseibium sp. AS2 TaxID=3135781 RepID=UPI0031798481